MKTISKNLYRFSELTDEAKKYAMDGHFGKIFESTDDKIKEASLEITTDFIGRYLNLEKLNIHWKNYGYQNYIFAIEGEIVGEDVVTFVKNIYSGSVPKNIERIYKNISIKFIKNIGGHKEERDVIITLKNYNGTMYKVDMYKKELLVKILDWYNGISSDLDSRHYKAISWSVDFNSDIAKFRGNNCPCYFTDKGELYEEEN